eukprot:scaffold88801_cov55-Attheya_sp.AAC.4
MEASPYGCKVQERHFVDAFFFISDEETKEVDIDDISVLSDDHCCIPMDFYDDCSLLSVEDDDGSILSDDDDSVELQGLKVLSKRAVRFATKHVTEVHYRPRTNWKEVRSLYYDDFDMDRFRAERDSFSAIANMKEECTIKKHNEQEHQLEKDHHPSLVCSPNGGRPPRYPIDQRSEE